MDTSLNLWRENLLLQIRYREKLNQKVICAVLLLADLEDENTKPYLRVPEADHPLYGFFEKQVASVINEITPDQTQEQVWELIQIIARGWNA